MEKMTSCASFIHKDVLVVLVGRGEREWGREGGSYKSQTGEMVPVLTGTDLLPSPQGHKVSLLMHAVKGNLANTVCKRKHQHIASVLVLGRPCMLFSNFDSFLRGQGRVREGVMDFFSPSPPTCTSPSSLLPASLPPPLSPWCHPDPKSRGGGLGR